MPCTEPRITYPMKKKWNYYPKDTSRLSKRIIAKNPNSMLQTTKRALKAGHSFTMKVKISPEPIITKLIRPEAEDEAAVEDADENPTLGRRINPQETSRNTMSCIRVTTIILPNVVASERSWQQNS